MDFMAESRGPLIDSGFAAAAPIFNFLPDSLDAISDLSNSLLEGPRGEIACLTG
jgi:hypothetical protein